MTWVISPSGEQLELSGTGIIPTGANTSFGNAGDPGVYAADTPGQQVAPGIWNQSVGRGALGQVTAPASQNLTTQPTAGTTSVSQVPQFQTSQANAPAPTAGSVQSFYGTGNQAPGVPGVPGVPGAAGTTGTQFAGQPGYQNPSQVSQSTKEFGEDSSQFNIDPFAQPFPFPQQKGENLGLVSGFEQALQAQETLPAMRSRYENRFFIPELREAFQTGREALSDVMAQIRSMPETIAGTSRESLMTAGQKQNLLGAKLEPLQKIATQMGENVSRIGAMLTENEKNLNDAMMMEVAQQKKMLQPWQWKYDMQEIMQAREFSGWTFSNELELNRLLANQASGLTWTNAEAQRASDLAIAEMGFQNALDQIRLRGEQDRESSRYDYVDLGKGMSDGFNPDWLS